MTTRAEYGTRIRLTAAALCLAGTVGTAPAHEQELTPQRVLELTSQGLSAIAQKTLPAVVYVYVEKALTDEHGQPLDPYWSEMWRQFFARNHPWAQPDKQTGHGSGFIISRDGYIISNHHIVESADRIMVRLYDGREFEAELIGTDAKSEIAVIRIDAEGLVVLPRGDSTGLQAGEFVVAIGNPFGLAASVSVGTVSGLGRSHFGWGRYRLGITDYESFIQTDAEINPGNSGGPLINVKGEAVGINTAIFSRTGASLGIGFAVPMEMAGNIADQLIKSGRVSRGYLGVIITEVVPEVAEYFGLDAANGIVVSDVAAGSAAADADLRRDDVILHLNGEPVESVNSFRNRIAVTPPETTIKLGVFRHGVHETISVIVGELAEEETLVARRSPAATPIGRVGLTVKTLDDKEDLGFKVAQGLLITGVRAGSPAAIEGIGPGDVIISVNRKFVASMHELRIVLDESKNKRTILLLIKNEEGTTYHPLTVPQP